MTDLPASKITRVRLQELRAEFAARVGRFKEQGLVYMGYTTADPLSADPKNPDLNNNTVNIHDMDGVLAEDLSATIVTPEQQEALDQEYSSLAVLNNVLRLREEGMKDGSWKPRFSASPADGVEYMKATPDYDTKQAVIAPPEPF